MISNITTDSVTTASPTEDDLPVYWGYISCVIAILFFGSNWVPVKKFETGDGLFFQWVSCAAIWFVGLCVHLFRYPHSTFFPLAMLGGVLWCTGNVMTVPIIKTVGLGQGILIWGSANLISGWASGRFGMFGLKPEKPHKAILNYIGMSLCLASAAFYILIKSNIHKTVTPIEKVVNDDARDALLENQQNVQDDDSPLIDVTQSQSSVIHHPDETFIDRLSPTKKRIVGTIMSIVAGLLYGINFAPVIYIQDNYHQSKNGLDYIFAHFCGIFATSTAFLAIYCAYMQNKPRIYPEAILPGLVAGLMWGIADAGWFVANSVLSEAVSFPIVTTGPGMIGCLWGLFFKEITGLRNYVILAVAFSVTISGAILTGLSKG